MANSLKNLSILLSPKFLSPLSPSRNLINLPRSDGKMYLRQISRSNVVKKLDFSPGLKQIPTLSKPSSAYKTRIPDIRIDSTNDETEWEINDKYSSRSHNILDLNTPVKQNLVQNGLDKFKTLTTVLGKGTFGIVFKGKHKGETVAVKLVTNESCYRERNALHLSHKNITRVLEIIQNSEYQNYSLVIMEYLPNCRSLQDVLDNFHKGNQGKSATLLKQFALDTTSGLNYLHNNGVIHLDLKPKNILVNTENLCKICDFGNSVRIGENLDNFKHNGTLIYTAPEILVGRTPTIKSDIYSLGLVFWQIKYQRNPFEEYETIESIIYNIGKHGVRPAYKSKTPDALTAIFTKCWDSDPELRPTTVDILEDLEFAQF